MKKGYKGKPSGQSPSTLIFKNTTRFRKIFSFSQLKKTYDN